MWTLHCQKVLAILRWAFFVYNEADTSVYDNMIQTLHCQKFLQALGTRIMFIVCNKVDMSVHVYTILILHRQKVLAILRWAFIVYDEADTSVYVNKIQILHRQKVLAILRWMFFEYNEADTSVYDNTIQTLHHQKFLQVLGECSLYAIRLIGMFMIIQYKPCIAKSSCKSSVNVHSLFFSSFWGKDSQIESIFNACVAVW